MPEINMVTGGGWIMIPILLCSLLSVSVIFERFFSLRRASIDARDFMDTIRGVLGRGQVREALFLCDQQEGFLPFILKAGIRKHGRSREEIREAIADAGTLAVPTLERYLSVLATVANVAPLLGLLGTVLGMVQAFTVIPRQAGVVSPGDLAGGIGTALLTTVWGLIVAIPTLVAYNYFVSRVDHLVWEMEILSAELLDVMTGGEADRDAAA